MKFSLATITALFATAVIAAPLNAKRGESGSSSPSTWGESGSSSPSWGSSGSSDPLEEVIQSPGSAVGNSATGNGNPSANGDGNPSANGNGNPSATGNGNPSASGNSAGDGSANGNGDNSANNNNFGNVGGIDIDPSIALSPSVSI